MPRGYLSIRSAPGNRLHHLYRNNHGFWWAHYTIHWDGRKRRIRRSLKTRDVAEAIRLRDELFERISAEGEEIEDPPPVWGGELHSKEVFQCPA